MKLYERVALSSIPALDTIRALSVTLVILAHLGVPWASGLHGVMAFFVLSGFLITWLLLKENDRSGTVSLRDFYHRRALRIFPAFYVFWVVYVILVAVVRHQCSWIQYLSSLLYVSNYYQAVVRPEHMAMAHTWSVGVEEQFYLLWPWLFLRFKDDLSKLTGVLTAVILAVWIHRLLLFTMFHPGYEWLYGAFDCRADHLAIGCLAAVLIRRRAAPRVFKAITASAFLPFIPLVALATSAYLRAEFGQRYQFLAGFMLDPILMVVLMIQWIALSGSPGWRWLNHPVSRYLGRISYSAYLYHWLVTFTLVNRFGPLPLWMKAVFAMVGANLLASASYFIVEKPFLRLKKRSQDAGTANPITKAVAVAAGS